MAKNVKTGEQWKPPAVGFGALQLRLSLHCPSDYVTLAVALRRFINMEGGERPARLPSWPTLPALNSLSTHAQDGGGQLNSDRVLR